MNKLMMLSLVAVVGLFIGGCAIPDSANAATSYVAYGSTWVPVSPWWPWYAPRPMTSSCPNCAGGRCNVVKQTETQKPEQKQEEGEKATADTPPKLPDKPCTGPNCPLKRYIQSGCPGGRCYRR